ncbi:MAG: PAS domain S-box protein, partial [Acidobacteriia bacterium]|nr:PAS domain S-box protein [Terriglobia bacterium]
MSNAKTIYLRQSPEETIRLLQQELADTNSEVLLLTLELEKRVADLEEANRTLRRHKELIDLSNDAVITMDAECRITGWSRGAEEIYGWSEEEALGNSLDQLLRTELPAQHDQIQTILEEKLRWHGELTQMRRDGKRLTVDSRQALLRDNMGGIAGILAINRDLTERQRLEEQLRQSQKLESIGQLAGGVAHDFNNLLTVISGYAEMILPDLPANDSLHEAVEEISLAASRAASLTRQLLAFSRRQAAEPVDLVLNEVVRGAEKMLRRLINADVRLMLSLDPEEGVIHADRGHVEQVIMNLAVNARDAMRQGGKLAIETRQIYVEEGSIPAGLGASGNHIELTVSDTGTGMPPEVKARIFEPFFTTKEKGKGTGLGLSMVYGIVKQSHGWISVESEPGLGTTFRILWPQSKTTGEQARAAAAELHLSGTETVLLAEDEAGVRRYVRQILERNGYRVLEATNGREALAAATQHGGPIHLLVTDIVMPEVGGLDLAEQMAKLRPGIAILCVSGYSDVLWRRDDLSIQFMQKPFASGTLLREVRKL